MVPWPCRRSPVACWLAALSLPRSVVRYGVSAAAKEGTTFAEPAEPLRHRAIAACGSFGRLK